MAKRKQNPKQRMVVSAVLLIAAFVLYFTGQELGFLPGDSLPASAPSPQAVTGKQLEVHFIDVGQGDSILIKAPGGVALIDAGLKEAGPVVADYLADQGVERLDVIINTHPHADHVGGMGHVIGSIGSFGSIVVPGLADSMIPTTRAYESFLDAVEERDGRLIQAVPGAVFPLGEGAALTILGPVEQYDEMNDNSVVCRLDYGSFSCLLTGDSELRAERDIQEAGYELSADLLKLGHHGSSTSTDADWLQAVNPGLAIVSCGLDNSYGHPHREVTAALERAGVAVCRTDLQGSVVVSTDGTDYTVATER